MHRSSIFLTLSLIFSLLLILSLPLAIISKPYLPYINYLLGSEKPTSYLILLGNDAEMRANGGFTGSYAKLIMQYPQIDLSFQDIYVPNGQLQGYVTPPQPIQDAFQHGTWQLANADWEPDFATSASTIRWFMEKGNEINPDNLVLLNLTTIKKVLDVVGSFKVAEYDAQITPDNLYLFLQGKAEVDFFPGSTQKKDALTAVGLAFKQALLKISLPKKIKIAQIIYQDLQNQNILINSKNPDFQTLLEAKNFGGRLLSKTQDTFSLVEANLGANKANAYVTRDTKHQLSFQNDQVTHQVTITFKNSSPESNPNPPFHYGGDYKAYLRLYIPLTAKDIKLDHEATTAASRSLSEVSSKFNLTEIGFWQITPAQNQTTVNLSYTLPVSTNQYSLSLLKQHGLVSSPQTIQVNNKTLSTPLLNDYFLSLDRH